MHWAKMLQANNWREIASANKWIANCATRSKTFYYLEAELLDERKLREWFELLTEDIRYWMPMRHNPLERPDKRQRRTVPTR